MPDSKEAPHALESLDADLTNVDKAELGDWAAAHYRVIRFALEELASSEERDRAWRQLAFFNHACTGKYGDDGEMQCNHCMIDFKREAPAAIVDKLYVRGIQEWQGYRDEKKKLTEQVAAMRAGCTCGAAARVAPESTT